MTAIYTILQMQMPRWEQPLRYKMAFEATGWAFVMTSAETGVNLNDHRHPWLKPEPDAAA